jgi:hypothetical protein
MSNNVSTFEYKLRLTIKSAFDFHEAIVF